jgi:hypothetical protein
MFNWENRVRKYHIPSPTEQVGRGNAPAKFRVNAPINVTGQQSTPVANVRKAKRVAFLMNEMRNAVGAYEGYGLRLRELSIVTVNQLVRELEDVATWYRLDYHRTKRVLEPDEQQRWRRIQNRYGRDSLVAHAHSPVTQSPPGSDEWAFAINFGRLCGNIKMLKWLMGYSFRRFNTASFWERP